MKLPSVILNSPTQPVSTPVDPVERPLIPDQPQPSQPENIEISSHGSPTMHGSSDPQTLDLGGHSDLEANRIAVETLDGSSNPFDRQNNQ